MELVGSIFMESAVVLSLAVLDDLGSTPFVAIEMYNEVSTLIRTFLIRMNEGKVYM